MHPAGRSQGLPPNKDQSFAGMGNITKSGRERERHTHTHTHTRTHAHNAPLQEEVRRLERNSRREGANLEYLKNIVYKYMITDMGRDRCVTLAHLMPADDFQRPLLIHHAYAHDHTHRHTHIFSLSSLLSSLLFSSLLFSSLLFSL